MCQMLACMEGGSRLPTDLIAAAKYRCLLLAFKHASSASDRVG